MLVYVLLSFVGLSLWLNWHQYRKADRVYGYRLTERDTLTKALTDTTHVLSDMLKDAEEGNTLMRELADTLNGQSSELDSLRQAVGRLGELARDNHLTLLDNARAASLAVAAMAESIRVLDKSVVDHRVAVADHVHALRQTIHASEQALKSDLRQIIGIDSTIVVKKRRVYDTRPTKRA